MKLKVDFITNSSSAAFSIPKKYLTDIQIQMIYDHIEIGCVISDSENKKGIYINPEWKIYEEDGKIKGYTTMDNFDMMWFLKEIGVPDDAVKYEDHC